MGWRRTRLWLWFFYLPFLCLSLTLEPLMMENKTVTSLVDYFLAYRGDDIYITRYFVLQSIFQVARMKFVCDINEKELFRMQYNYSHYVNPKMIVAKFTLYDENDKIISAFDVESKLNVIMNKLFLKLSEVLKEFMYAGGNYGFKG